MADTEISKLRMPEPTEVKKLVRRLANMKKNAQAAAGEMGEAVAKACETKHFDRKALSIARSLESMSDEKLAITLPHLIKYIEDLDLADRAEKQAKMFAKEEEAELKAAKLAEKNGAKGGKDGPKSAPGTVKGLRIVPSDEAPKSSQAAE